MPAKAMTYKFLNTFIDDLFAFTIKMPTLHRLATLRDDVIFFVYIYQKWAYKVDHTRVNEFGQGGDDDDPTEDENVKGALAGAPDKDKQKGKRAVLGDLKHGKLAESNENIDAEKVKASGVEAKEKVTKRK
jgi:hypothetical protein